MKNVMYGTISAAMLTITFLAGTQSVVAYNDNSDYIIQRILFCIDGSYISSGNLSTYCNG